MRKILTSAYGPHIHVRKKPIEDIVLLALKSTNGLAKITQREIESELGRDWENRNIRNLKENKKRKRD